MSATATRLDPALHDQLLARVDACFVQAEARLAAPFPARKSIATCA